MTDDYLWSKSGEPDPEVARLEQLLEPLRHRPSRLEWSRVPSRPAAVGFWTRRRSALALAASLALVAAGVWVGRSGAARDVDGRVTWTRADGKAMAADWIETDASSTVRLTAESVGQVDVHPGSRLRVVRTRPGDARLALDRGSLHAFIWAPPGRFAVETSSATAVDLGCSYTLEVDGLGGGRLRVESGWVGLASDGAESLVPAGASCHLSAGRGPGTPHFDDAPTALTEAVARIDAQGEAVRDDDVRSAAVAARPRDGFTLWHLLRRLDADRAAIVYDRLASLAPPPPGVTRERVLAKDRAALEAWWDSLGLGSSRLFRTWRARPAM